jgi:hypothetical protein
MPSVVLTWCGVFSKLKALEEAVEIEPKELLVYGLNDELKTLKDPVSYFVRK